MKIGVEDQLVCLVMDDVVGQASENIRQCVGRG